MFDFTQNHKPLAEEALLETTSSDRLQELAKKNSDLARIVASNPTAPAELLRELSSNKDCETSKAVAK